MKSLVEKLNTIQSKINSPKTRTNTYSNFKYRNLDDICEAVKPLLKETGLVLLMNDEVVHIDNRFYVKATVKITDGEHELTIHGFAREPEAKKGMDDSQVSGMASSYARKYALNGLFCLDDVPDADHYDNTKQTDSGQKQIPKKADCSSSTPSTPAPSAPPAITEAKTKQLFDVLAEYYKTQENERFKFNYDKFIEAVWKKYGKYPTTEQGAKKIKSEITIADCWVEVK